MWGNLLIIESPLPTVRPEELQDKEEDRLVLGWEQRRWLRGRFTTVKGRKIGLALPTGTTLDLDTILCVEPNWYLRVEAAIEPVLEIHPSSREELVRVAFEVGNRHFPLAIREDKLLVPDDKAMTRLMDRLGVPWERRQAVFNPIGNAQPHQHG
jgi:urease accessory protein